MCIDNLRLNILRKHIQQPLFVFVGQLPSQINYLI